MGRQGPMIFHMDSEDNDQTERMHRLIGVFAECTCQLVPYAGQPF